MTRGETNVLCSEPILFFAFSSGTTGKSKLIPTTRRQRRVAMVYPSLMMPAVLRELVPDVDRPARGIVLFGASDEKNVTPGGTPVGSASGSNVLRLRRLASHFWTSPWPVYTWGSGAAARYGHALFGLKDRTALTLTGLFAPYVLEWLDFVVQHWDALLSDLERGTIESAPGLSAEQRAQIAPFLSPAPARAAEIRAAVGNDFAGFLPRAWPSLRAAVAISSGSFAVYEPRLRNYLGAVPLFSPSYMASEGTIGYNFNLQPTSRYTLAVGSAYFEFVPSAAVEEAQPRAVSLDELSVGEKYEVVLSNYGGLYRYRMRDVVQVVGFDGEAPVIEFDHRHGTLLNLAGENTTEAHTHEVIMRLLERWTGDARHLVDYTTRGDSERLPARYVVYLELNDGERWAREGLHEAARRLDQTLAEVNAAYDFVQKAGWLTGPELKLVSPGTFRAVTALMVDRAGGVNTNQVKVPRRISTPEQVALLESRVVATGVAG